MPTVVCQRQDRYGSALLRASPIAFGGCGDRPTPKAETNARMATCLYQDASSSNRRSSGELPPAKPSSCSTRQFPSARTLALERRPFFAQYHPIHVSLKVKVKVVGAGPVGLRDNDVSMENNIAVAAPSPEVSREHGKRQSPAKPAPTHVFLDQGGIGLGLSAFLPEVVSTRAHNGCGVADGQQCAMQLTSDPFLGYISLLQGFPKRTATGPRPHRFLHGPLDRFAEFRNK